MLACQSEKRQFVPPMSAVSSTSFCSCITCSLLSACQPDMSHLQTWASCKEASPTSPVCRFTAASAIALKSSALTLSELVTSSSCSLYKLLFLWCQDPMLGRDNVKEPEPWNSDIFHSGTDQCSCVAAVRSPAKVSQNMIKRGTIATDQAWQ